MLTNAQINRKIAGIAQSAKAARENVQIVLIEISAHAYVNGDVTLFQRLFDATSGMNRKRIVKWIKDYGFATLTSDGVFKLNKSMRKNSDFTDGDHVIRWLTDNAREWWADEETAAQVAKELDVAKRIKSLTSQVKNAREKNTVVKVDFTELRKAQEELNAALADAENLGETGDSRMADTAAH